MTVSEGGVPSPIDVTGPIRAAVGDALVQGAGSVIDGLGKWLFSSLGEMTAAVFGFVDQATRPNVMAGWFIDGASGTGPYRATATVAATIMTVLVFGGVIQGVAQGDAGAMIRRMALHAPVAVLGIGATVVVVQILIELTDAIALYLTRSVGADTATFAAAIQSAANTVASPGAPLLVLGFLMLVAALVVFIELLVRSLLIYVIVALCPLAWAALVWPALQGALRKTLELLMAVILSKVVIALALAVGAAAMSATALSGAPSPELAGYAFSEPGSAATPPAGLTEGLGLLATGVATLAVAAFSPFLIAKLLPFAEGAVVAQGTRGAPMRAGQQVSAMSRQFDVSRRFSARGAATSRSTHLGAGGGSPGGIGSGEPSPGSGPRGAAAAGGSGAGGGAATQAGGAAGAGGGAAGSAGAAGAASVVAGPVGVVAAAGSFAAKGAKAASKRVEGSAATQTDHPPAGSAGGGGHRRPPAGSPTGPSSPRRDSVSERLADPPGPSEGPLS